MLQNKLLVDIEIKKLLTTHQKKNCIEKFITILILICGMKELLIFFIFQ